MKAKLRRKSQKKRVPRTEAENMLIDKAWCAFIPEDLAYKPRHREIETREHNLRTRLFIGQD
jgi:hypothetical protein